MIIPSLSSIEQKVQGLVNDVGNFIKSNPLVTVGSGVALAGAVVGTTALIKKAKSSKKKKTSKKKKSSTRRTRKSRRRTRIRRTPYTAGKRRDRSTKRIRYTKTGQPYIILRSGKARFITKKGAKLSRKRKGGRY